MAKGQQDGAGKLPANKVFVLQLDSATGQSENRFAGRLEHVASGEVIHFESQEQMMKFIGKVLRAEDAAFS